MTEGDPGHSTRRDFLVGVSGTAAGLGAAASAALASPPPPPGVREPATPPPEAPPKPRKATGIDRKSIEEAERVTGIAFTDPERDQIVEAIDEQIQISVERRTWGLPPNDVAPASRFDPRTATIAVDPPDGRFVPSGIDAGSPPESEEEIAHAPVTTLGHWIKTRQLTSTRLTEIYLERLRRLGPALECVVTLTESRAQEQAAQADRELAAGVYRGPLHGIPWGAKDLLDTRGIRTTWGAAPYRDRTPETDAVVVRMLEEAGAVLVAKLTLGALAYGDVWFDGKTRNPWDLEQGSSGSSAGPAAAVAAGLVGFAIGSETYGSIVSPCMRCGTTGLRPTFGRVPRTGAMALCWSLDKLGPIARTVEDCLLVLHAVNGFDEHDPSSLDVPLGFVAGRSIRDLRVGFDPAWFEDAPAPDRHALEQLENLGVRMVQVELPDWPYRTLLHILFAEAAAAFEELTLTDRDDELVRQDADAWPNTFRRTRFLSAIEYVQADRFRRQVMRMMSAQFDAVDLMISPSFAGAMLLITNHTGHPSLTLRAGFTDEGRPRGITLWGRLFDEGRLGNAGTALETALGVWDRRPEL